MVANEREITPILKDVTELYRIERRAKRLKLSDKQAGSLSAHVCQVNPEAAAESLPAPGGLAHSGRRCSRGC